MIYRAGQKMEIVSMFVNVRPVWKSLSYGKHCYTTLSIVYYYERHSKIQTIKEIIFVYIHHASNSSLTRDVGPAGGKTSDGSEQSEQWVKGLFT